ncbi:MAG: aldo/keto reductase [Kiritimatiellia bacterium]
MLYKDYGATGKQLSAIGFGGMRLPHPQRHDEGIALLHAARRAGITYFDTAPFYCDDQSEDIFGEALRSMPPSPLPLHVSSKCSRPAAADFRRGLEKSLSRLGVPRITFFHLWCVMDPADWKARIDGGALRAALQAKEEGLVEHVCVSTHMNGPEIERMLLDHPEIEGVTLGTCAINFPYRRQGVEAARRLKKGVVAMNPLGGGLIPQHPDAFDFIRAPGDPDVVSAALRFLVSDPAVTTALVGFSSAAHVEAAVRALETFAPHSPEHLEILRARIEKDFNEMCTGCGYCLPCPQGIPIPRYMDVHNLMQLKATDDEIRARLKYHWDMTPAKAAECVECGLCESRCTQHLPIIARLKKVAAFKT